MRFHAATPKQSREGTLITYYPPRLNEEQRSAVLSQVGSYVSRPDLNDNEVHARPGRSMSRPPRYTSEAEALAPPPRSDLRNLCDSAFTGEVRLVKLRKGVEIYRVFDSMLNVDGIWWSQSEPPNSEDEWRNRDAVLGAWNANGAYIKFTIQPGGLDALIGQVATQNTIDGRHYDANAEQLFVPGGTRCFEQDGSFMLYKSRWAR